MPNEKDTKASNENTLSAYESLFGDMEADTADTNAEERAPKHGTDPAQPNSDAIEDQAKLDVEETQAGEAGPTDDLKVVVSIREGMATIGVQRPSSDPHIESFDDLDLSGLAQRVSAVTQRARARWEETPKHPAHARPATTTGRRPRRERGLGSDGNSGHQTFQAASNPA